MPPHIRPATAADLPGLGRLGALLMQVHYDFDNGRFLEPGADAAEGYAHFLSGELDDPRAVVLVAEERSGIVGYVYASVEPRSWKELRDEAGFIHDLVVVPAARGCGVGSALLDAAAAWLRPRVPRLVLWTAHHNTAARRLFERAGFRPTMVEMAKDLD
jgi:ribosomal protein S18 acetylase RimI-like enzyme